MLTSDIITFGLHYEQFNVLIQLDCYTTDYYYNDAKPYMHWVDCEYLCMV